MLRITNRVAPLLQALADFDFHGKTDGQLLEQFLTLRDEAAFTALIRRHGSMVLGVCRRILGNAADADDAFQATFLVLVRKAPSLVARPVLGDWLHGVARRTALKARRTTARRREQERTQVRDAAAPAPRNDWLPLLDEELTRLPEKYRLPIVLCDLEEKTRREAAAALGWPEGTVAGRLARGRALLAKRLIRGAQLQVGVVSAALAVESALSAGLVRSTVDAALGVATGKLPSTLPPATIALADGVIYSMFLRKLTAALAIVLCVGLFGAGLGLLTNHRVDAGPEAIQGDAPGIRAAVQHKDDGGPAGDGAVAVVQEEKDDKIQDALRKAVVYLKAAQANGNWETQQSHVGGYTSLALWALLEAGVKADDPTVAKGLEYLRTVKPHGTYVVSLQTVALCRAGVKSEQDLIKRNVTWLLEAMVKDNDGQCLGWTYVKSPARADNSNTQYAVMALDAAAKAGTSIDAAVWKQIKEHYLRSQQPDGGWGYVWSPKGFASQTTANMTSAGIAGLAICEHHLKEPADEPMKLALGRLAVLYGKAGGGGELYYLHSLSRAGALSGQKTLENNFTGQTHDWRLDSRRQLLKAQTADGSWRSTHAWESPPALATSFAILALSAKDAKK